MNQQGTAQVLSASDKVFQSRGVDVLVYEDRPNKFHWAADTKPLRRLLQDMRTCLEDRAQAHYDYAVDCYGLLTVTEELHCMEKESA